ncbi:hypothetical protein BGZ49_004515 [Haplosporangium sp. Z 27]|nr:hypothetical protein BGZ49_004515 [Haplosporangium sp. Z 27]
MDVSSLHKIMNDQTFVLGDLRAQLDEMQDVLNRVTPKQDTMSIEERQIIQNAQIMMSLAEEVIATNITADSKKGIEGPKLDPQDTYPLTISMPTQGARSIDSTETPPPSAITPPPGLSFPKGHLRHRSSSASVASSVNSDRQYTPDSEDRFSRPSSVASSYRNRQKKKSLRQLEPLPNNRGSRYETESNASFDRICSILTELITDASTAVSTAPDGTHQPPAIPLPELPSLEQSESEISSDSASDQDDDADDSNSVADDVETATSSKVIDDPFLKRLQGPGVAQTTNDVEVEVELEPVDRYRTGFRSRPDKSKRLSSLFMELQNTQTIQDAVPKEELAKEKPVRRPRHSSSFSFSSTRSSRHNSVSFTNRSPGSMELLGSFESPPESPLVSGKIRQRDSISSLRSEPQLRHSTVIETPVKQDVDPELNRTVETIDGLTRDLVTVATHQNWMQAKLQKTLQFQKEQIQQIERAHSTAGDMSIAEGQRLANEPHLDNSTEQHPLADLSRSLKQVALSVGKVLANSASVTQPKKAQKEISDSIGKPITAQPTGRLSRKDFSRYFQELEKIAALGGRIGFGKSDDDGTVKDESLEYPVGSQHDRSSSADSEKSDGYDSAHNGSSIKGDSSSSSSRRGSVSIGPPELEDFAAQCRLLTRALVLPFVQLTHHAMTSQDSAFALHPRSSRFSGPARDLDSTLEIVEDLDIGQNHLKSVSPKLRPSTPKESNHVGSSPDWSQPISIGGRDLESILKAHGEMSPDAIVKAKTFISTGLYLLHLLYWTVLFVIGTVVLDPWLAETAGMQVVRIVDQVRNAIAKDPSGQRFQNIGLGYQQQGHESLIELEQSSTLARPVLEDTDFETDSVLEHSRLQAHEDRAIEVAVGFESLRHRISGSAGQPFKSLWNNNKKSFQTTASALTSASSPSPASKPQESQDSSAVHEKASAQSPATSNTGVLRTVSWVGPRKRRPAKDGSTSRVRRFSNTRTMALPLAKSEPSPTITPRRPGLRQDRPVSHWGSFGVTTSLTGSAFTTDFKSWGLDNATQNREESIKRSFQQVPQELQTIPKHAQVRRKSF